MVKENDVNKELRTIREHSKAQNNVLQTDEIETDQITEYEPLGDPLMDNVNFEEYEMEL